MTNHLALSDEDFLKQPVPETVQASSDQPQTPEAEAAPVVEEQPVADPAIDQEAEPQGEEPAVVEPVVEEPKPEAETEPKKEGEEPASTGSEPKADAPKQEEAAPSAAPDQTALAAFYNQVMTPFVANGKKIELKTPEEAIQLMQMGANYTRKMQDLAPHRKLITMLSNNGLDEDKISFLIDLDKGDPEAIKKFIKDKGIDPLDIDTNTEPAYREGSHKVSDAEAAFNAQLEDISSTPGGLETLQVMDTWDQASKDKLWQNPDVMPVIDAHRKAGIFAKISEEIDRRKTLGQLRADTPFLDAYQIIGEELHNAGAFGTTSGSGTGQTANVSSPQADPKSDPTPVATRAAAPKPDANAAKAAAAATTRTTPVPAKVQANFLSMSDEDFLKQVESFSGRV